LVIPAWGSLEPVAANTFAVDTSVDPARIGKGRYLEPMELRGDGGQARHERED